MIAKAFNGDHYRVFGRFCAILLGVAITWTCAIYGLLVTGYTNSCSLKIRGLGQARDHVREVEHATAMYLIENAHCPRTIADLVDDAYLAQPASVDSWDTTISISCSADDWSARSAGPDRVFGTADDITSRY
jgi:hypothetical protein